MMSQVHGTAQPVFSISAVARMVGVPVATIRTWESRYRQVVPERNASGHRLYDRDQVEQLRFVRARVAEGLHAADAHRLLAEWLDGGPPPPPEPARAVVLSAPAAFSGPAVSSSPALPSLSSQTTVLLAERDPYAAEFQVHFLTTEGFDVEVALSEEAARSSLGIRRPAVAVIELLISGGAGLDLCRSFKRHGVPVIVSSVLQARDQAIEAGADAFLGKPLDPLRLVSAVRDLVGLTRYPRPGQDAAS